jgi:hypothetical protein
MRVQRVSFICIFTEYIVSCGNNVIQLARRVGYIVLGQDEKS